MVAQARILPAIATAAAVAHLAPPAAADSPGATLGGAGAGGAAVGVAHLPGGAGASWAARPGDAASAAADFAASALRVGGTGLAGILQASGPWRVPEGGTIGCGAALAADAHVSTAHFCETAVAGLNARRSQGARVGGLARGDGAHAVGAVEVHPALRVGHAGALHASSSRSAVRILLTRAADAAVAHLAQSAVGSGAAIARAAQALATHLACAALGRVGACLAPILAARAPSALAALATVAGDARATAAALIGLTLRLARASLAGAVLARAPRTALGVVAARARRAATSTALAPGTALPVAGTSPAGAAHAGLAFEA